MEQPIPLNPESLYVEDNVSRFRGAPWFREIQTKYISIIGLGGIGSYVAFFLSRCQPGRLLLYDSDIVEEANLSGQLYRKNSLGKRKTTATVHLVNDFSNYYDTRCYSEFNERSYVNAIAIGCVDNMKTRRTIFDRWVYHHGHNPKALLIDGRLAAESFQIFCIRTDDSASIERYEKEWLFSDKEADPTICSYKQTSYAAGMIGAFITNLVINHMANISEDRTFDFERSLPFMTSYDADLMIFKAVD